MLREAMQNQLQSFEIVSYWYIQFVCLTLTQMVTKGYVPRSKLARIAINSKHMFDKNFIQEITRIK